MMPNRSLVLRDTPHRLDSGTVHVVGRILQRRISCSKIIAVIAKPNKTTAGHSGRINYFGYVEGRRPIPVTLDVDVDGAGVTVANIQTRHE